MLTVSGCQFRYAGLLNANSFSYLLYSANQVQVKEVRTSASSLGSGNQQNNTFESLVVQSYDNLAVYYKCKISDSTLLRTDVLSENSNLLDIKCKLFYIILRCIGNCDVILIVINSSYYYYIQRGTLFHFFVFQTKTSIGNALLRRPL